MRWTTTLALFLALSAPAAAGAPHFSKSYHGTITGHMRESRGSQVTTSDWTVKGVVLKLYKVRPFEGGWSGFYAPTAGTVSYSEAKTGDCTWSLQKTFALKTGIQSRREAVPFFLDKSPLGRWIYDASLRPTKKYEVTETCTFPDGGEPVTSQRTLGLPELLKTGSKRGRPGRTLTGKYVYKDDGGGFTSTTTYRWDLKP